MLGVRDHPLHLVVRAAVIAIVSPAVGAAKRIPSNEDGAAAPGRSGHCDTNHGQTALLDFLHISRAEDVDVYLLRVVELVPDVRDDAVGLPYADRNQ